MAELAAHEYHDVDEWGLSAGAPGFDGLKYKFMALEGACTLAAEKPLIAQTGLNILAMGIGLPKFDHGIGNGSPQAVEYPAPDGDPLTLYAIVNHQSVVEAWERISVLFGGKAIGKIRADGLGWGLGQGGF